MKLGIIASVDEESFKRASQKGLEFLEFCLNGDVDPEKNSTENVKQLFENKENIKSWIEKYKVAVGSIGRWGSDRISKDGSIIREEMDALKTMVDVSEYLGCENVICGCNYVEELSFYENCTASIAFLTEISEYAKKKNVRISVYNCRWNNYICEPVAWKIILGHLKDVGIKFDPSHSIYAGGDYLKEMKEWGHRFNHVHIKGSLRIDGERFDDPPAGLDETNWGAFMSILYTVRYDGGLSIEPHSENWTGELGDWGVEYTIKYLRPLIISH